MNGRDVDAAVSEMLRVLGLHVGADWSVRAGSLEWSCWTTAAHVAHDLLACAGHVAARPGDRYLPFDLAVDADASPRDVLRVVTARGGLLRSAAAGPGVRAWHFALDNPGETLLHTYDITHGLGVAWLPRAAASSRG